MGAKEILAGVMLSLLLVGCVTVPAPLEGRFDETAPSAAPSAGSAVRWGGRIVAVEPEAERTCFQILGLPLAQNARPRDIDEASGRFVACRDGFYDPAVFVAGRELTVTGRVTGSATRLVGAFEYTLPEVAAEVIYLWPRRQPIDPYGPRHYDPFWGPPGWGWGVGWRYGPHWW